MIACSVVVPTFGRAAELEQCLTALAAQTMPSDELEVIVADDAAAASTQAQVVGWSEAGMNARYVPVAGAHHGPAAARNAGWRAARGWLVAFTDDDTIPEADWVQRAHDAFVLSDDGTGKRLDAAWGRIVVPLPLTPSDYERDVAGLEHAGFVTANCFVRREHLRLLGGFDEAFTIAWREDSDLFFRLLARGRRVDFLVDSVVVHPVRPASWGVSVSQQRKAAFDALLYKKHPTLFGLYVHPGRPRLYYPIVGALLAAFSGAAAGIAPLALAGGAAWAALTGTFAARRLRGTSHAPRHVAEMLVTSAVIPPVSLFWRMRGALQHRVIFW
jgi:GT2 family glycosyltransferase